jgi:hypothetical protein
MWTRSHIIILTIICPRMRTSRTFDRCNCRHFCLGIDVRMSLINIENSILKWLQYCIYCIHCMHCVHKLYTLHALCKICIFLLKINASSDYYGYFKMDLVYRSGH